MVEKAKLNQEEAHSAERIPQKNRRISYMMSTKVQRKIYRK